MTYSIKPAIDALTFLVPGVPTAWARARTHGAVHFTPARQRSAKHDIQSYMIQARAGRPMYDGPIQVEIDAYWPRPKSLPKRHGTGTYPRTSRPDVDNVAKIVLDAGNGVLWGDDAMVTDVRVRKWVHAAGEAPRLLVVVRAVGHGKVAPPGAGRE